VRHGGVLTPLLFLIAFAALGLVAGKVATARQENMLRDAAIAAGEDDFAVSMSGSVWRGVMTYKFREFPFVLRFAGFSKGKFDGEMDWGYAVLRIKGFYRDNHLDFVDTKYLRGKAPVKVGDSKTAVINGNRLTGTDLNGRAQIVAERVP
jgi:hypothetical protein